MSDGLRDSFFTAIILGKLDEVKAIVPDHPEALSWMTPGGYPPLHMAILNHRSDIAVYLVECGADIEQEAQGETAANAADRKGMLTVLQDAKKRQDQCRNDAISVRMHKGLRNPVSVSRRPLSLKRKPF